ncbi:hypothetical protein N8198_00595 [Gammaproteobacteria bacterium]|nr:hypothetical protein [Gammaproteobacteria bacterium]
MNMIPAVVALLIALLSNTSWALSSTDSSVDEAAQSAQYVSISVDRVVVDTAGLAAASATLAGSVDRLALAIGEMSADSSNLSDEQRQILLDAVTSAHQASVALTELAQHLPLTAQGLSERLPQMINDARAPITELSASLQAARDSVAMITESLPLATANATQLMDSVLDSALQKLIVYTIALFAIIALALIAIIWFIYWQYLSPLTRKLDELVGAPEHFELMARHMKGTSDNLLALQDGEPRVRQRGMERFRRR